jgi:hypothetical protein
MFRPAVACNWMTVSVTADMTSVTSCPLSGNDPLQYHTPFRGPYLPPSLETEARNDGRTSYSYQQSMLLAVGLIKEFDHVTHHTVMCRGVC